jgi:hypothetical protein
MAAVRDSNRMEDLSTFQVPFGQDAYPISRLIVQRARALGLSRTEFARRLG